MSFCRKWAPFNFLVAALFLCMADLTRHLINDAWGTACTELEDGQTLYILTSDGKSIPVSDTKYCHSRNVMNQFAGETDKLSVYGWLFTVVFTWSGFVCLFIGIGWILNLPHKVAVQWRAIRRRQPARSSPGGRSDPLVAAA